VERPRGQISKENAVKVVVKQPEGVKLVKNVSWRYITPEILYVSISVTEKWPSYGWGGGITDKGESYGGVYLYAGGDEAIRTFTAKTVEVGFIPENDREKTILGGVKATLEPYYGVHYLIMTNECLSAALKKQSGGSLNLEVNE